jgi:acetyltransferase-like isoleucine patch superfamily enzyme
MNFIKIIDILFSKFYKIIYSNCFSFIGCKSLIYYPLKIKGNKNIYIGNNVIISNRTWLEALPLTGEVNCKLIIGDGTNIGNFNHIYATKSIEIGKNVLTADKVYISDNLHSYENINIPVIFQPIKQINTVIIGDGSWLGENVCVIGAKIGRNCVIGANSVVTKDIPDYCVVVGSPGKIIKRYCFESKTWKKTDNNGIIKNI